MINLSFVLQKTGRNDDVITINETNSDDELLVVYKDGDRKGSYRFTLDSQDAYQYASDLLRSLSRDADPFDYIQVLPCTGPSIIYHIWELEDESVRDLILGQVHTSICGDVTYNPNR